MKMRKRKKLEMLLVSLLVMSIEWIEGCQYTGMTSKQITLHRGDMNNDMVFGE